MELRTLRAFVEVTRRGGFSAAGKTVFATQPTISKAVKQLEDELGGPLLERLGRNVRLTALGELVYKHATAMLGEKDLLLAEIAEMRGLRRGTLRIGLPPLGSSIIFAPMFTEYRRRHPEIDIMLQEQGSARLEELLLAGEIELGASLLPVSDVYEWQQVSDEPMVALLPPKHPLYGQATVKLADLAESGLILFEKGYALNAVIEAATQRRGFAPKEAARSAQPEFIVALVAAGLGVALLPKLVAEQSVRPPIHTALVDDSDLRWRLALIWRKNAHLSPSARAWIALTTQTAGIA